MQDYGRQDCHISGESKILAGHQRWLQTGVIPVMSVPRTAAPWIRCAEMVQKCRRAGVYTADLADIPALGAQLK
jgi:hypothetical protein